jgi:hypothetical protein
MFSRKQDFTRIIHGISHIRHIADLGYLAKYGKNVKREKLLKMMCLQSQVLELFA